MKPPRKHIKLIALFLAVTFLVQSCKVYKYKATTLDEVVKAPKYQKIKVKTGLNQSYEFIKLVRENGRLYGLAKIQSETARKLKNQIIENSAYDYVKIIIHEEQEKQFKEFYLRKIERTDKVTPYIVIGLLAGALMYVGIKKGMKEGGMPSF